MRFLARPTLLAVTFLGLSSLCLAQNSSRTFEPAPPPVPAAEYIPNKWHTFSQIPGFSITMPGDPTASTRQIDTAVGQLTQNYYLLKTEIGDYTVSYVDFPTSVSDPNVIKRMLDSGRDNMLATNKGMKLLAEQEIKIAGYDGRELLIEQGDVISQRRAFIIGNRLYQIALSVPTKVAFKSGRASADSTDFTEFYKMIVSKYLDSARTYNSSYGYGSGSAFKLEDELRKAVRGGVLNGKAISLPRPSYPADAAIVGATGTVTVQVLVDEEGAVIWARGVSGHPLLQEAARKAALKARFSPLKVEGKPAKVTGVLTYYFTR